MRGGWPIQAVFWLEWGCPAAFDLARVERTLLSVAFDVDLDPALDLAPTVSMALPGGTGKGTTPSRPAKPAVTWKSGAGAPFLASREVGFSFVGSTVEEAIQTSLKINGHTDSKIRTINAQLPIIKQ